VISTIAQWAVWILAALAALTVAGMAVGHLLGTNKRMDRIFREELDTPDRDTDRDDLKDQS
jgi:hypothetical protein